MIINIKIPTELTDKQIEDFQKIYKEKYGTDISREDAIVEGLSLIRLVSFVIIDERDDEKPSTEKGNIVDIKFSTQTKI